MCATKSSLLHAALLDVFSTLAQLVFLQATAISTATFARDVPDPAGATAAAGDRDSDDSDDFDNDEFVYVTRLCCNVNAKDFDSPPSRLSPCCCSYDASEDKDEELMFTLGNTFTQWFDRFMKPFQDDALRVRAAVQSGPAAVKASLPVVVGWLRDVRGVISAAKTTQVNG